MAIAWIVFREHVDRRLLFGAFCILVGAPLLSWQGRGVVINAGALLVALACLAWGIDNNVTRKLSSADPLQIAMIKGVVAGSVNLGLSLAAGARLPDLFDSVAVGVLGFLGYGVSLVLFVAALRHLGTARTGAYFSFAPFIGAVLGIAVLGEPLTGTLVVAGGSWQSASTCTWRNGTATSTRTSRPSMSTATSTMNIINTSMLRPTRARTSDMRTLIAMRHWRTGMRTIPTCTIGTRTVETHR